MYKVEMELTAELHRYIHMNTNMFNTRFFILDYYYDKLQGKFKRQNVNKLPFF